MKKGIQLVALLLTVVMSSCTGNSPSRRSDTGLYSDGRS